VIQENDLDAKLEKKLRERKMQKAVAVGKAYGRRPQSYLSCLEGTTNSRRCVCVCVI
jgi:hypothetical protein